MPTSPYAHFLRVLSVMQHLLPAIRRSRDMTHVPYENKNWIYAIDVVVKSSDIVPSLLQSALRTLSHNVKISSSEKEEKMRNIATPLLNEFVTWLNVWQGNLPVPYTDLKLHDISHAVIEGCRSSVFMKGISLVIIPCIDV